MARLDVTETFHSIKFPGHMHTQDSLNYAANFKFQDTDTVIVTYPKSGTTWMQEIIALVLNKGDPALARSQPNWSRAPWLEQCYCPQILQASTGPRIVTTHLPYHILAPALRDSKAKVIYVARNPVDVAVSYYHFHKMENFLPDPGTFSEFLSDFMKGTVHYGSWFDHVKGWTDHAQNFQKFLHIPYEEMCQDLRGSLEKVSCFLQCSLTEEELKCAQKYCSFNSMKENIMVNYTREIMDLSKGKFMRKVLSARKNVQTENAANSSVGAPTLQIALDKAKKQIEIQKQKILHLEEKAVSLTDERNFLRSRLEDALNLRREAVNSPGQALTASSSTIAASQKNESSDEPSDSSESSDSSDSEPRAKKKKREKKHKNKKKSEKMKVDFRRVRTPEDSIKRYHSVLKLVKRGFSKAEAYNTMKVDRNTIVSQAPIAELATANPEEYKGLRATFKKGESIQKFSDLCLARCLVQPNVIKSLKESSDLLDISKK